MNKKIFFLSHYTKDTPYEEIAYKYIIPSFKKFNLNYEVVVTKHRGSWRSNANIKSELIYQFLQVHDILVWTDCDSEFLAFPKLFWDIDKPVAVHELDWNTHYNNGKNKKEILGGTVYLTKESLPLAKYWMENAPKFPREPHALEHYIRSHNIDFYNLPPEYCAIVNKENKIPSYYKDVVILHWQASRQTRKTM